jgi:hypothetical protein
VTALKRVIQREFEIRGRGGESCIHTKMEGMGGIESFVKGW